MSLVQNTAFRDYLSIAWGESFDSGTLEIRTAGGAVLLATITLPATAFGAPAAGVIAKAGTWSVTAVASGVARVGRFISSADAREAEVTIGLAAADMIIDDEDVVNGGTVTVTTFTYTTPAS